MTQWVKDTSLLRSDFNLLLLHSVFIRCGTYFLMPPHTASLDRQPHAEGLVVMASAHAELVRHTNNPAPHVRGLTHNTRMLIAN